MSIESNNFSESTNEWVESLNENIRLIDETLGKLWYKLTNEDWRAWRIYESFSDPTNKLNIYWWIRWVPKDKKLTQSDIVSAIFDQNTGVRNKHATEQINSLLWMDIPQKFNRYEIEDLKWLSPYVENYKAIPFEEYKDMKGNLIYQIYEQEWIELDYGFSFDWNIVNISGSLVLMIDWKWINREDENHWKIERINVNFTKNIIDIIN